MQKLLLGVICLVGLMGGTARAEWKGTRIVKFIVTSKSERFLGSIQEEIKEESNNEKTKTTVGFYPTKEECLNAIKLAYKGDFELDKKGMQSDPKQTVTIKDSTFPRYSILAKMGRVLREDKTGIVTATADSDVSYSCVEK